MSAAFDPYVHWLAIRDPQRPPNHYRLLGLDQFESDSYVIASAADRQIAHIRKFLTGRHPRACRKVLGELNQAKACLLNVEKKKQYDARLRQALAVQPDASRTAPAKPSIAEAQRAILAASTAVAADAVQPNQSQSQSNLAPLPNEKHQRARKIENAGGAKKPMSKIVGAALLLVAVSITTFLLWPRKSDERRIEITQQTAEEVVAQLEPLTEEEDPSSPLAIDLPTTLEVVDDELKVDNELDPSSEPPVVPDEPPTRPSIDSEVTSEGVNHDDTIDDQPVVSMYSPSSVTKPDDETSTVSTSDPDTQPEVNITEKTSPAEGSPIDAMPLRQAPPSKDEQQEAVARVQSIYAPKYEAAATDEAFDALAVFLTTSAENTHDDPAARFALFIEAQRLALQTGNWVRAIHIIDLRHKYFETNALTEKTDLLDETCRTLNAHDVQRMDNYLEQLFRQAVAEDRFDLAKRCLQLKIKAIRKTGDNAAVRSAERSFKAMREFVARKRHADKAQQQLQTEPTDVAAHRALGEYLCYNRQDWDAGLPHFAQCDDERLQEIAAADLTRPDGAAERKKLADLWYQLAQDSQGSEAKVMFHRARHWYLLAMPELTGLSRDDATQKLAEMDQQLHIYLDESSDWQDLLAEVVIADHAVAGKWRRQTATIIVEKTGRRSFLSLPKVTDTSYDLEIKFNSQFNPGESVVVRLPIGSTSCILSVGPRYGGIGTIDRRPLSGNETTNYYGSMRRRPVFKLEISVVVQEDNVTIRSKLDGRPFVQWQGDPNLLGEEANWSFPDRHKLGLGSWSGGVRFQEVRYRSGE